MTNLACTISLKNGFDFDRMCTKNVCWQLRAVVHSSIRGQKESQNNSTSGLCFPLQEMEELNEKMKFLNKRMHEAEGHKWKGMFKKHPLW